MHIAFITSEYPHSKISHSAGIGTSIKNLASGLVEKNIKVSIFVHGQNSDEIINDNGVNIYKLKFKKYRLFGWFFHRKHINKFISKAVKDKAIDLLEAPDWTGITSFMKFKCPLIIKIHGSDTYFCNLENRKQKFKNYLFEKLALFNADEVISVSEFSGKKTKEIFNYKKDIDVLPNGIDMNIFKSNSEVKVVDGEVLYFGSFIRKKGALELASIFNELVAINSNVSLKIIGSDVIDIIENKSTRMLFEEIVKPENLEKIQFLEFVEYIDIPKHIAKANVIVLPSFAEALPMTWMEAMAMKKALIVSNIGWSNEMIINDVSGYAVNPTNHKEYAKKINDLLLDKSKVLDFGIKANEFVHNNFSNKVVISKHINFYKKVLNNEI